MDQIRKAKSEGVAKSYEPSPPNARPSEPFLPMARRRRARRA